MDDREAILAAMDRYQEKLENSCQEQLEEKYHYREYEEMYDAVLAKAFLPGQKGFEEQPAPLKALAVAVEIDFEIQNGGVEQYLWNSGCEYVSFVGPAMRELGLPEMAALFEEFAAAHPALLEMIRLDRQESADPGYVWGSVTDKYTQEDWDAFDAFDDAWMALWDSRAFNLTLLGYARRHGVIGEKETE